MAPTVIAINDGPAPTQYAVNALEALALETISAVWDGSGAAGAFIPAVGIYAQSGELLAKTFVGSTVPAGDTAECTFAPFLRAPSGAGAGANTLVNDYHVAGSYTWTKPANCVAVEVIALGAGGGGNGGGHVIVLGACSGGPAGGGGGVQRATYLADQVPGTVTVTVGLGGAGHAGYTSSGLGGVADNGAGSDFGALLHAGGGGGGQLAGAGGGGSSVNDSTSTSGGTPSSGSPVGMQGSSGRVTGTPNATGCGEWGGGGGGPTNASGVAGGGGGSLYAGAGGGGGGSISGASVVELGAPGGASRQYISHGGGAISTNGSSGLNVGELYAGSGGGGGSAVNGGAGGNGGSGGLGCGGGGGGASVTPNGSDKGGAGGTGGDGRVIVVAYVEAP